jgi:hypothetical protein
VLAKEPAPEAIAKRRQSEEFQASLNRAWRFPGQE